MGFQIDEYTSLHLALYSSILLGTVEVPVCISSLNLSFIIMSRDVFLFNSTNQVCNCRVQSYERKNHLLESESRAIRYRSLFSPPFFPKVDLCSSHLDSYVFSITVYVAWIFEN